MISRRCFCVWMLRLTGVDVAQNLLSTSVRLWLAHVLEVLEVGYGNGLDLHAEELKELVRVPGVQHVEDEDERHVVV